VRPFSDRWGETQGLHPGNLEKSPGKTGKNPGKMGSSLGNLAKKKHVKHMETKSLGKIGSVTMFLGLRWGLKQGQSWTIRDGHLEVHGYGDLTDLAQQLCDFTISQILNTANDWGFKQTEHG
jgi:hypothetical protein